MLNSLRLNLLHLAKLVLGLSQKFSALLEVFLEGRVFELELIKVFLHGLVLDFRHVAITVSLQDVDLPLELVVLTVQEVHLVLKFDNGSLVLLILVLQIQFLKVLGWSIQIMEAQNFIVSDLDRVGQFLGKLLFILQFQLELS